MVKSNLISDNDMFFRRVKEVISFVHFKRALIFSLSLFTFHFASAQQLQSYIQEAQSNNPDIQAFELRHTIDEEKVNEADWIPNTEFSAGYFVSEPETRTGAQRARFSAKQMLPWFGTITARENYANSLADATYVEIVIAKRKLALAVAQSYYRLYTIKAKQKVLNDNIELLKTYERLALTSVEVGNASAVDVLRLQIRQNELQQQSDVLGEGFVGEQASFNSLLNRDESTEVLILDPLGLPTDDLMYTQDDLQFNPELLKYDKLYESVAQSEILNQAERKPMVGFGLDYVPVSERPEMNFSDNGKDIFMPMVAVSIPIFNTKNESKSKQNELRQLEITSQKNSRLNVLNSAFAKAVSTRNQARIIFNTQTKNLKQASDAEEILIKNYETGTIDFNDVLDIQELQLKFQMNQVEATEMYYIQSAIINYLMN